MRVARRKKKMGKIKERKKEKENIGRYLHELEMGTFKT
jgi:hypothetical protein